MPGPTDPGRVVRLAKGAYLGHCFLMFGLAIALGALFLAPPLWLRGRLRGRDRRPMQSLVRFFFTLWLRLLRAGGLLKGLSSLGRPCGEPCVIVGNHPGLFDVLFLIRDIPDMVVMVKRSLAQKLPLGPIFSQAGYILSDGRGASNTMQPLLEALEALRDGQKIQLFPEGTRSPLGGLGEFKSGAFRIARMANVPVQPVLIRNDPPFLAKGGRWYLPPLTPSRLRLEYWEPLPPPRAGQEEDMSRRLRERFIIALREPRQAGLSAGPTGETHRKMAGQ